MTFPYDRNKFCQISMTFSRPGKPITASERSPLIALKLICGCVDLSLLGFIVSDEAINAMYPSFKMIKENSDINL